MVDLRGQVAGFEPMRHRAESTALAGGFGGALNIAPAAALMTVLICRRVKVRALPSALRISAGILRRPAFERSPISSGRRRSIGEPRGCPGAEPVEYSLVQGPHGQVVDQRRRHDRLVEPLKVVGVLPDHRAGDVRGGR